MYQPPRRTPERHNLNSVLAYDIETISHAEQPDGSFPPWPTHQPVAVGLAGAKLDADGNWSISLETLVPTNGDDALFAAVDERLGRAATLVTYNGRGFDAPVLQLSAMRSRQFELPRLAAHANAARFGVEHADLADLLAAHGATKKVALAAICHELGVPVKTSACGSDVAALWAAGKIDQIRDYVLEDATVTLIAWFAWSAFRYSDEALITRPMAALARLIEETPAFHHLQGLVDCDLMRWARPQAMRTDIRVALDRVQRMRKVWEDQQGFVAPDTPRSRAH